MSDFHEAINDPSGWWRMEKIKGTGDRVEDWEPVWEPVPLEERLNRATARRHESEAAALRQRIQELEKETK